MYLAAYDSSICQSIHSLLVIGLVHSLFAGLTSYLEIMHTVH